MRLLLFLCFASISLRAQITFGGCFDSRRLAVGAVQSSTLNDVARAVPNSIGPSVIQYNPNVLSKLQPATRLFFYAHECAHLAIPTSDESKADCWAAKTLSSRGLLNDSAFQIVQGDIAQFGRGDWTHLAGPQRAINLAACLQSDIEPRPEPRRDDSLTCTASPDEGEVPPAVAQEIQRNKASWLSGVILTRWQNNLKTDREDCRSALDDADRYRRNRDQSRLDSSLQDVRANKKRIANDLAVMRAINQRLAELDH